MIVSSRQNRTEPNPKKAENRTDENLLYEIAHSINAELRHDGEYHADCPFCGKTAKQGHTHFTFGDKGFYCFPCGAGGSLKTLAAHLEIEPDLQRPKYRENVHHTHFAKKPSVAPLNERVNLEALVKKYHSQRAAYKSWLTYMPYLSRDTFDTYHLGEGRLPARQKGQWQKTRRLILPIIEGEEIVGLRGRLIPNKRTSKTPKWIFAAGGKTPFFNSNAIAGADIIVICENNTDSIGIGQQHPQVDGLSLASISPTTGVRTAIPQTILNQLVDKIVILWTDNDKAGREGAAKWQEQLKAIAARVITFKWVATDPDKTDLGDLLIEDHKQSANRVGEFLLKAIRDQSAFLSGFPDAVRNGWLRIKRLSSNILDDYAGLGLILETLTDGVNAGKITPYVQPTIQDIQTLGIEIGRGKIEERTIRRAFHLFFDIFSTSKNTQEKTTGKNVKNSVNPINKPISNLDAQKGRPAQRVWLPLPDEIIAALAERSNEAVVIGEYVRGFKERIKADKNLSHEAKIEHRKTLKSELRGLYQSRGINAVLDYCRLEYFSSKTPSEAIRRFEENARNKIASWRGSLDSYHSMSIIKEYDGIALSFKNASCYRKAINLSKLKAMPGETMITTNAQKADALGVSPKTISNYRRRVDEEGNRHTLIYAVPHCDKHILTSGKSASKRIQAALATTIKRRGGCYGIYISWSKGDTFQFREVTGFKEVDSGGIDWRGIDRAVAIWQQRGYEVAFNNRIGTRESLSVPERLLSIEQTIMQEAQDKPEFLVKGLISLTKGYSMSIGQLRNIATA